MSTNIKYLSIMLIILLVSCFSCKEDGNDTASAKNEETTVRWDTISAGLQNAEIQKKPVLIFFYTEWCIYCKKMDSEVFSNREVSEFLNENFISIRVNPEKDTETFKIMGEKLAPSKLMAYTGSNGFPTTFP